MDPSCSEKVQKQPKRGIIYLSTIPPNMNVIRIREYFEKFGKVDRIFLQPDEKSKPGKKSKKRNKYAKSFTEGWVEFVRKSVAKKVVALLNNRQIDTRKKSKLYDSTWNMKYLSRFKWVHLNERLAYEKAVRRQRLRAEIAQAKREANFFAANVDKNAKKRGKTSENDRKSSDVRDKPDKNPSESVDNSVDTQPNNRELFLKELFS